MHKILVTWKYFGFGDSDENIKELFHKHDCIGEIMPLEEAMERLEEFEGIIVGTDKITPKILDKSPKLKVIMKYGVGTDNIDKEAAKKRNIEVLNLPGINCDAVAELVVGLILALARKIVIADKLLRKGYWNPQLGMSTQGKILGILGTGAVGLALTEMVSGLKMKVIGYDITLNESFIELGGQYVDREEVIRKADFLSINIPLNNHTFHSIGAKELKSMKKTAFIINTSRGATIDEKALYQSVKSKEIAGAAVDVYETEPPSESPLIRLDNVITTPHLAAFTHETFRTMDEESVAKLSTAFNS
jgi:lactate dehydrogenase-like 2-hydroxyacid dehydrogenase